MWIPTLTITGCKLAHKLWKSAISYGNLKSPKNICLRAVIPNLGAAAHKSAAKKCQGCRQILNLLPFFNNVILYIRGCRLSFLAGEGAAQFFFSHKGCCESKRVEKYCLRVFTYKGWGPRVKATIICCHKTAQTSNKTNAIAKLSRSC